MRHALQPRVSAKSYLYPERIDFNTNQTSLQEALEGCQNPQTEGQRFLLEYYTFLVDYNRYLGQLPTPAKEPVISAFSSPTLRAFYRRGHVCEWS